MTPILFTYKKKKNDFSTQYFELISVVVIVQNINKARAKK